MAGPDLKQPCKGCRDRHEACHGNCAEYKAYAEEMHKKRIFIMRENNTRSFPPTMKYKKSSGCYVVSKGISHKKVRQT